MGLHADQIEKSIHNAYIEIINNSKHYIYIENQFFVSMTSKSPVKNQIAKAIGERIAKAALNNENFKVLITLPLLPGFEGDILEKAGNIMRIQLGWLHKSLVRDEGSVFNLYADCKAGCWKVGE